ncbi:MAG: DUF2232 domain-containing protein, partial [Cyanobacteria bacterium CAN_BIN43]|nr:DUF2232 domain-containing protein [Cyanobacteria bacterium CAN_BIN43]
MSGSPKDRQVDPIRKEPEPENIVSDPASQAGWDDDFWAETPKQPTPPAALATPHVRTLTPPLAMVETAFLASTASLLWMVSYYLSIGPWVRILFPTPIALVYLRWGARAA